MSAVSSTSANATAHTRARRAARRKARGWRRGLFLAGAAVTFALAVVGALLPGIPTTPFLLLTSYCLVNSSPALHRRLLRSPVLGELLTDWQRHRGIRRAVKLQALAFIVIVLGLTLGFSPLGPVAKLGVVMLAAVGIFVVARLRVIEQEL